MNELLRHLLAHHFNIVNNFDSTFLNCNDINFLFQEHEKHIQDQLQIRERESDSRVDESVVPESGQ